MSIQTQGQATPMPKAAPATIPTLLDLPSDVAHELVQLENLLRLVAFATEARRTLWQIDQAKTSLPEVQSGLTRFVDCANQWKDYEDNSAIVLTGAADRLADILAKV